MTTVSRPRSYRALYPNPFPQPLVHLETGAGGNCQFTSLSASLYPLLNHSADDIRHNIGRQVYRLSQKQLDQELKSYQNEENFSGGWDPHEASTHKDLADAITNPIYTRNYWGFQGDDFTLMMFAHAYQTSVIVFMLPHGTMCRMGEYPRCCFLLCYDLPDRSASATKVNPQLLGTRHYQSLAWDQGQDRCQSVFHEAPQWLKEALGESKAATV